MANQNTFAPPLRMFHSFSSIQKLEKKSAITVIGAGAFGGWSALYLMRKGLKVTLVDAWGAGNSRSSSGDETRVIRSTYGANENYFDLNVRAIELWKDNQEKWNKKLFYNTGVLWLCYEEKTPMVDDSIPFSKKHKMEYGYFSRPDLEKRFPTINSQDLHHAFLDPFGGYLKARESCQAVLDAFVNEGGNFIQASVQTPIISNGKIESLRLSNNTILHADSFLFACGSWMGKLFPDLLGNVITCSKQEVYYFGVPESSSHLYDNFPVWVDVDGKNFYYGIPGNTNRGFKIGVDIRGGPFDPTHGERTLNPDVLSKAREFISHRFPGLKDAPLIENRVCPYENSPDGNFIFSGHPEASNVVLLGGGSGHGFKHGPALGELVANTLVR
jgi:glycine/D-amino acid oxidase-like deaminating enzyme